MDGALIANETLDYLKSKHLKSLIFKVDFEKAFDCLNWDFLMEIMGFGDKWRKWIHSCLKSASISVLVNGSPTSEFNIERGVRQGDPLSPFLFILAAEGLNVLTKMAVRNNLFIGVEVGNNKIPISHLQYADDTIFFGEWGEGNLRNLMKILKCFELTSGLKVNYHKSILYGVGVDKGITENMAKSFKCNVGSFPFTYLGIPVGGKMNKLESWASVISKFEKRLSDWKARSMSYGGRLTLVKSVLNSNLIDSFGVAFKNSFVRKVGDGASISFWSDIWLGSEALKNKFQRLARLDSNMEASVKERLRRARGELDNLGELLKTVTTDPGCADGWVWGANNGRQFTTKKLTTLIDSKTICAGANASESLRNNLVPKKIEVFIWRARKKRLPVRTELDKRGVDLHSVCCSLCDDAIETVDHSLMSCKKAFDVWTKVFEWWGLGNISNLTIEDLFLGNLNQGASSGGEIWQAVVWSSCYLIWWNRNQMVFKNKCWNTPAALSEIQVKCFEWIAKRHTRKTIDWHNWFHNPSVFLT
ncbi:uncharacterized protein [Rutidosis leptorrhynchoides]|uniref:uncharacterized protein n=1 Tax=Rutidosis leptorrhynchoides TaxID=125765 RepID=UPI003A9A476C